LSGANSPFGSALVLPLILPGISQQPAVRAQADLAFFDLFPSVRVVGGCRLSVKLVRRRRMIFELVLSHVDADRQPLRCFASSSFFIRLPSRASPIMTPHQAALTELYAAKPQAPWLLPRTIRCRFAAFFQKSPTVGRRCECID
jgi:hypothetical protein